VGTDSIWLSDSPNWVWQVCDSLSEIIHTPGGSRGGRTAWAGKLASTSKAFNFWLCNARVSGRGGTGPGRPSGMPREYTCIKAREAACSEGGSGIPDLPLLGTNAFDDQLASEKVVRTFFLRVGVRIGMLGVTVEIISTCEIRTRHWTGEQGAAVVVAAEEWTNNADLEWLLLAHQETKGGLDGGAWPYCGETFQILAPGHSFIPLHIYYEFRTNVCRWSQHHNKDGAYRQMRPYPGNTRRFRGGIQQSQGRNTAAASVNWPCNRFSTSLKFAIWVDYNWAEFSVEFSWVQRYSRSCMDKDHVLKRPDHAFGVGLKDPMPYGQIDEW